MTTGLSRRSSVMPGTAEVCPHSAVGRGLRRGVRRRAGAAQGAARAPGPFPARPGPYTSQSETVRRRV